MDRLLLLETRRRALYCKEFVKPVVLLLAAALGYAVESTWYVAGGKVEGAKSLKRAAGFIHPDGSFWNASFERRDKNLKAMAQDWAWNSNPFMGTKELNGLKALMMLLSNWD